jgi:tetratricopeptide (TPR) repeat protein
MSIHGGKGGAMRMRLETRTAAALAIMAMLGLSSTVACSKIGELKGKMTFKDANEAYQAKNYPKAAQLYEETLQNNPDLAQVYFFLGNSYDNQYKPGVQTPDNTEKIDKAVKNYTLAADKLSTGNPDDAKLKMLALQYLAAVYGSDKLDDPGKAEPVIQRMIQMDPHNPDNYVALARLYEDAGFYPEAEEMLVKGKEVKPSDPNVYMQLAGYYNRQNQFDKTIDALEQRAKLEPNNPEAYYMIATYYWDNAQHNVQLKDAEKRADVEKGLAAVDKALQIRPDYMEAIVYKGLLLRVEALLEKDPAKQQALIKEADQLHDKAEDLRKKKASGVSN